MGYILAGTIIGGIIWGIVVNKVIENKGYEENWFWWGFFFGIFALIIALTKQSVNTTKVVIESSVPIKENMELLSSCILNNQVNISSPVHITSWEIKKDTEKLVLFVDFINVSQKTISAVMFSATGFNSFSDRIQMNDADFFDVIGQDLCVNPNEYGKVYAILQDDAIRKVEVKVKKVCFKDGTIVDDIHDEWINTNQSELKSIHIDCARRENAQSKYYSIIKEHYWQCVCGFVNSHTTCAICGMQKSKAIKFTQENFDGTYNNYLNQIELERLEAERKIEKDKILLERKKKRNNRIAAVTVIVLGVTIALTTILNATFTSDSYKYRKAVSLSSKAQYQKAMDILVTIQEYKDSQKLLEEVKYSYATELLDKNQYEKAIEILLELERNDAIEEAYYKYANFYAQNQEYNKAILMYYDNQYYKDSKSRIKELSSKVISSPQIGNIVGMGTYEQDDDKSNGKEIILWEIIDINNDELLLLCLNPIDILQYHNVKTNITWENSYLRRWLNSTFYEENFSNEEKQKIVTSLLINHDNEYAKINNLDYESGNDTMDNIFLLSINEAKMYTDHLSKIIGNAYVRNKAQRMADDNSRPSPWMPLRTRGSNSESVALIPLNSSNINEYGYDVDDFYYIAPALWISSID